MYFSRASECEFHGNQIYSCIAFFSVPSWSVPLLILQPYLKQVTEEFSSYQSNLEWCGTLKNEALFEAIAACVADMDNVELAAATLHFFMTKMPAGL